MIDVASLEPLVDQRDVILVTGKGGTGKSTLVAALAALAVRRRRGAVAVEFSTYRRLPELIAPDSGVRVVKIDLDTAVEPALRRLVNIPVVAQAVLRNRVVRQFIRTSPAVREMIVLDELRVLVDESTARHVPVIVDLPATGHALSFLDTPRAVQRMFRIGPIAHAAERVQRLLLDGKRCEMVTITLPEELPVNETLELLRKARQMGIAARMVVVNQVPAMLLHASDRPLLEILQRESEEALAHLALAAQSQLDGLDHARKQIERLRGLESVSVVEFPSRPPTQAPDAGRAGRPVEPAAGSAADLATLIADAPLVVCVGPGGVGKTTLSALLALRQAAAGRRALVLTIDPARRLADALGLDELTNDPMELTGFRKMHPTGTLSALMLDPTATFDHMIALLVPDPVRREALLSNRVYQHISRSLSGTLEYMAVERVHELFRTGRFDRVVLDTPPTGNAVDFLEAPDRVATFFSDKITRWFMPAPAVSSWTSRLWSRAGAAATSLIARVAGPTFVDETVGFFAAFSDLLGHFRSRGEEVGRLLRDPRTVFLVVCAPDPARIVEAQVISEHLADEGCVPRAFIVNRVEEAFLPGPGEIERAVERAAALLGGLEEREQTRAFMDRLEKLRRQQESAAALHAQVVEAVREFAAPRPVFTVPRVPVGETPRDSLLAMYLGLFARDD
jgi:anion-transporting  ArsA/GET3 family ATPase